MRLFIGTFLNSELHEYIPFDDIQKMFESDLKTIRKENIHMTWIFLGNVEDNKLSEITSIIEANKDIFKGLIYSSKSLVLWPPKKSPRLIVIGGELNQEVNLERIYSDLKIICNQDIKNQFLPHITVARFKKDKTVSKEFKLPIMENFVWEIREISLVKSILTSEGPSYEKIKTWDFKP